METGALDTSRSRLGRRRALIAAAGTAAAIGSTIVAGNTAKAQHLASQVAASSDNAEPAVSALNSADGPGVAGRSARGWGVVGDTDSNAYAAVEGHNANTGFNAAGVRGTSAGNGMGVDGQSVNGKGVAGSSENGTGISAGSLRGVAFEAFAPSGVAAIRVFGRARFSDLASGAIEAGQNSAFIPQFLVTATCHITVTLTSDPGGSAVQWVERIAGSGFRVHLTKAPKTRTTLSYQITFPTFG